MQRQSRKFRRHRVFEPPNTKVPLNSRCRRRGTVIIGKSRLSICPYNGCRILSPIRHTETPPLTHKRARRDTLCTPMNTMHKNELFLNTTKNAWSRIFTK